MRLREIATRTPFQSVVQPRRCPKVRSRALPRTHTSGHFQSLVTVRFLASHWPLLRLT